MLIPILIFIFGALIGSFLNVVIVRMRELHTIISTRSHCPECKKEIKWYDLVPFISFILLKTKCRACGKPISWQYPLVELGTAILFTALYHQLGLSWVLLLQCIIAAFLIVIFVYDLRNMEIPDEMLYPAILFSVILLIVGNQFDFKMALYGMLVGVGFLGLIYLIGRGKWMGLGDVKLAVLLGLVTPFPNILITLFSAFIIGSIYGIVQIILKNKNMKSEIPFGPFLIIGLYITVFYGDSILGWYLGIL